MTSLLGMRRRVNGRVATISGGTSAIGRAVAERRCPEDARLVLPAESASRTGRPTMESSVLGRRHSGMPPSMRSAMKSQRAQRGFALIVDDIQSR
jgi:NAD(P)-dependent dehydrogenase (short-subunit alcohol dehydrogenase family)